MHRIGARRERLYHDHRRVLQTAEGDPDVGADETHVTLPSNPAPNTVFQGQLETVGDSFRYVFNEQVTNPDGSLTVYAAHLDMLGPTAIGDLYIGRADCGVAATATTTLPTTTTSSLTTTTTTLLWPTLQLPAHVSAHVCRVLVQMRSLPIVSLLIEPFRLLVGCGP